MTLTLLQKRLLALHHGYFQPPDYLESWLTPDITRLLMQYGSLMNPPRVSFGNGRHLDCCRSCLEYATLNPEATPYFGMALSRSFTKPEDFVWWVHNWNLLPDGTLIDSQPTPPLPVPPIYFGVKWGAELWELIPKRVTIPSEQLPALFRTPTLQRTPTYTHERSNHTMSSILDLPYIAPHRRCTPRKPRTYVVVSLQTRFATVRGKYTERKYFVHTGSEERHEH